MGWQGLPDKWADHPHRAHNRLITSIVLNNEERAEVARAHSQQLATSKGPVAFLMAEHGFGDWDRKGGGLYDQEGLDEFLKELRATLPANVETNIVDGHINDPVFAETALAIFDDWRAQGIIEA